ncbi:MAG TPA: response regulator transcription factor [Chitinophagales bacterium]|nr:response regulator transcription factor [Chitinophagales bacterium]
MLPIKILALDDQPFYINGMLTYLKQWTLVGKATGCTNYDELLHQLKEDEPDIVFMELNLRTCRHDSFSILRYISNRYKNVLVAVLSRYNTPELIKEARENGARAFIDKYSGTENLFNFLHDYWCNNVPAYYVSVNQHRPQPVGNTRVHDSFELYHQLTKREREVMRLIVKGHEHDEIEQALGISYSTYKTHRSSILQKMQVKNEVGLVKLVPANNYINIKYPMAYTPVNDI